jgi:hypothetical protein
VTRLIGAIRVIDGGILEPCGDRDDLAGRERTPANTRAGEHLARVHADPDPDPNPEAAFELDAERGDGLPNLNRGLHGPEGVVLVEAGQAEDPGSRRL